MKERNDDYSKRRTHLKKMSDEELKTYFFDLANKLVDPLVDLAYRNTSKSIERSVLLRMGFSSIEAKAIVNLLDEHNLLRKGAGHCVYKIAKTFNVSIRDAGLKIEDGTHLNYLVEVFNHA
ncbi:MAG: ornithine aminomutase subunit alpha [Candidatus Izimaplasma sp.]|nr:ornithine aminomutase subunit alpha [Candidatus Izimaplasma bacterium]